MRTKMALVISVFSKFSATRNLTCDPEGHYRLKRKNNKHHAKKLVKDAEFRSTRWQLTSITQHLLSVKMREAEKWRRHKYALPKLRPGFCFEAA